METFTVYIGMIQTDASGLHTLDTQKPVEFTGELLATYREPGMHKGAPTDTRGTTQRLYRLEDGRMIVHVKDWSNWQREPTVAAIREVMAADLQPGGKFDALGDVAGFGRPLEVDEALALAGA